MTVLITFSTTKVAQTLNPKLGHPCHDSPKGLNVLVMQVHQASFPASLQWEVNNFIVNVHARCEHGLIQDNSFLTADESFDIFFCISGY
ncbi:hypothetical protein FGO68_gene80 [Halteria grandinella]|uniref:Uncharacterized protein n=1 Tax=Halteria grandinella TaxID=5974 RepID=A0A8J8NKZ3_HALGN|nr:hypothetical protein FGO68_gene80 [Halteria grandinella]